LKQNDLIPAHELAVSKIMNRNALPEFNLTIEQALSFLKRDEIHLPLYDKGWHLLTYLDIPLGLVKNLDNRCNSSFPKEWRIKMSVSEFKGERLNNEVSKFPL
jgi:16S rRNA (cytosine1407-C5)-methyltransferase